MVTRGGCRGGVYRGGGGVEGGKQGVGGARAGERKGRVDMGSGLLRGKHQGCREGRGYGSGVEGNPSSRHGGVPRGRGAVDAMGRGGAEAGTWGGGVGVGWGYTSGSRVRGLC